MNYEEENDRVVVEVDGKRLSYDISKFGDEVGVYIDKNYVELVEWKADLVKNHGVDLDEI